MKTKDTARCPYCNDSLGRAEKVTENDEGCKFTVYTCLNCDEKWKRPHNP